MKKAIFIFTLVISIFMTQVFASNHFYEIQENELENSKEETLKDVKKQLEEQDATRFYWIYEDLIDKEYSRNLSYEESFGKSTLRRQSYRYLSFSNGGAVYYKNYLGGGAELTLTLLDKNATSRYLYGNDKLEQSINLLSRGIAVRTLALLKKTSVASVLLPYSIYHIIGSHQAEILKGEVSRGSGCVVISYSEDNDGSAKVVMHWNDYPYQYVYDGAEIVR